MTVTIERLENNEVKDIIDVIPFSNPHLGNLNNLLELEGKEDDFAAMMEDTSIFKLSWKNHTPALYSNKDNLYHYIKQTLDL